MCNIIAAILLLAISHALAVEDDRHDIGRSFYIPDTNILDVLTGGYKIFESIPDECIHVVTDSRIKDNMVMYEDEKSFYKSVGLERSIGGSLMNAFTMGVTLSAVSNGIRSTETSVKGATLDIISYNSIEYIDPGSFYKGTLAKEVKTDFELPSITLT